MWVAYKKTPRHTLMNLLKALNNYHFSFCRYPTVFLKELKSDNLQYNMLVHWADGTRRPIIWHSKYFFFIIYHRLKTLYFHFCNFIKKNELKGFCKEFWKILWKKNNTWNIRSLFVESFVPHCKCSQTNDRQTNV